MILIVDDKRENILSLKKILELNDFKVDTALSGEEALKKVLKNNYFLIILDVQMPGMDGFEVAEAISGTSKTRNIPIIFLSAVNTEKRFITKGYASGAIDYITKPFDPDILILKVRTFYTLNQQTQALNKIQQSLREEINIRTKTQLELKEKNSELQSILETIPQIAFTAKPDGTIEFVNAHWYEYSASANEFPTVKDREGSIADKWKKAIETGENLELELCISKQGSNVYRWHLLRVIPVKENGTIVKWVGTFTDIEEQKRALDKKDEFISMASHELKTPLTSIKAYVYLLHAALQKEPDGVESKLFIERTQKQVDKLYNLITDLLDISRIESGKLKFNKRWFNFQVMLHNTIETINQTYPAYRVHVAGETDIEVFGDEMRLEQVLINYLSNAIKYSPDCKDVYLTNTIIGNMLQVAVKDYGIGIPKESQAKLFDKFYRADDTSNRFQGLGIGLYICSEIISRHNGTFDVESTPGNGSTFYFTIPIGNEVRTHY
jgi:signal transduction histidine kinase/DNA-binding response OmpR family regulator